MHTSLLALVYFIWARRPRRRQKRLYIRKDLHIWMWEGIQTHFDCSTAEKICLSALHVLWKVWNFFLSSHITSISLRRSNCGAVKINSCWTQFSNIHQCCYLNQDYSPINVSKAAANRQMKQSYTFLTRCTGCNDELCTTSEVVENDLEDRCSQVCVGKNILSINQFEALYQASNIGNWSMAQSKNQILFLFMSINSLCFIVSTPFCWERRLKNCVRSQRLFMIKNR